MNDQVTFSKKDELRIQLLYEELSDGWFHRNKDDEQKVRIICRNVSNVIHDCHSIWTGYISAAAVDRLNYSNKPASEICAFDHFYGRMNSGADVVSMFMDGPPDMQTYREEMYKHCKVHRVLKEENSRLRTYQNNRGMSWQGAYYAAGIQLIKIDMGQKKNLTKQILKEHVFSQSVSLATVSC